MIKYADASIRMILQSLAGNWQMSLVVTVEAACKSHPTATLTLSPNGLIISVLTSNPLTRIIL